MMKALMQAGWFGVLAAESDSRNKQDADTRSPIKHVIVVIGENRSFDHVFGTYQPRHGQSIANSISPLAFLEKAM